MYRPPQRPREQKQAAFLAAYSELGNVSAAALVSEVHISTHYKWMHEDPEYPAKFEEAKKIAIDKLEAEARRRAVEGVEEPVYQGGKKVGTIRRYSDTLLIFLLKGALPHKYKERYSTEITGREGGPIEVKRYDGLSDDQLNDLIVKKLAALKEAGAACPDPGEADPD